VTAALVSRFAPLAALLGAAAVVPAVADPAPETVVVTATPPDPVGNDAFSVVRVTPAQLRASHQIDDALKGVPGLSLFRRDTSVNANPTTQGVSLRSIAPSGAGRALVTLDGVPQNDPFGNWVIWTSLPAEDMGGAQVVRGAGAGPYGAGALTGVVALDEATGDGFVAGDLSGGARGQRRVAASGGTDIDRFEVFGSASAEASNGWIPVAPEQRGAADDDVTLDAKNASLRIQTYAAADTLISARFSAYQETRNSGIVGSTSAADGETASLTVAHPASASDLGWRLQLWVRDVGFSNVTYAAGTNRATSAPTNDQYATPATGTGGNAALRGETPWLTWEVGTDVRTSEGESRELFSFVNGAFTSGRHAGGDSFVGGLYGEAAHREDGWLFTAGVRADYWQTSDGHVVQTSLVSGAITVDDHFKSKDGTLPTARLGVRRDLDNGFYLRSAAYEGFRAPSLNELYRPFRLGNTSTLGNPDLTPEELYGAEIGGGWQNERAAFDGDVFVNQLHRAVTNVTLASCPTNFPCTQPPGVTIVQRQNVGDIDAWGVEGEGHYAIFDSLTAKAAFDYVGAHVEGGIEAPQLTGNRPAQAPRWTFTGGFEATPLRRVSIDASLRYEGLRYADDLNKFRLGAAVTLDARVAYAITPSLSAYLYGENLFDARVASTASFGPTSTGTGAVVSYSEPLVIGGGFSWTQ
jgi:outer membrane receptor protein involved in Fe transport